VSKDYETSQNLVLGTSELNTCIILYALVYHWEKHTNSSHRLENAIADYVTRTEKTGRLVTSVRYDYVNQHGIPISSAGNRSRPRRRNSLRSQRRRRRPLSPETPSTSDVDCRIRVLLRCRDPSDNAQQYAPPSIVVLAVLYGFCVSVCVFNVSTGIHLTY
jgi:hypothetical protein